MANGPKDSADFHVWHTDKPAPPEGDWLDQWCVAVSSTYPTRDAERWDQVGLHVGDPRSDVVTGVLVALDVTMATLAEADRVGANLLLAHHPLMFSPLPRLTPHTAVGRLTLQAARQGCAVYAAHTNVDKAARGTSHPAAEALGLTDLHPIEPVPPKSGDAPVKIVTFVPRDHTERVIAAMALDGAGTIGDYTECAFVSPGQGQFRPGPGASPVIGEKGELTRVEEDRVEMVIRAGDVESTLHHLRDAHPYDEVPFDLYPLEEPLGARDTNRGLGLIGTLPEPMPLRHVAAVLADSLPSPNLRLAAANPDALVRRVGVVGGAGESLIPRLTSYDSPNAVDVLVTGDLKHHTTLDALTMGLALIDAGHFPTENPAMDDVAARLEAARPTFGLTAPIHRSTVTTDPWTNWKAPA